ncbi:uncharacterized protein LOC109950337 [Prunus persica]|uniref:uncharacterized protein LOC109950337 n=1 Tax=Prunus persica TaxID=3760 RepID=UPI0009AB8ECC|nr:uncharacterized protein LOC109950337 [Prunus persica]
MRHICNTLFKEEWHKTIACNTFSRRNDVRLQLLENKLLSVAQCDMTIAQYFQKVKSICSEISELDPTFATRIKRIIIHGLRPEYQDFVAVVQGWPSQPLLVAFENLLADQEAMAKQMRGVPPKGEEETLYTNKSKGSFKQHVSGGSKRNGGMVNGHQGEGSSRPRGAPKYHKCGQSKNNKRFESKCYNCGKKGHMAKDCLVKQKARQE